MTMALRHPTPIPWLCVTCVPVLYPLAPGGTGSGSADTGTPMAPPHPAPHIVQHYHHWSTNPRKSRLNLNFLQLYAVCNVILKRAAHSRDYGPGPLVNNKKQASWLSQAKHSGGLRSEPK
jgi:hypothetical protein